MARLSFVTIVTRWRWRVDCDEILHDQI